MKVIHCADIHLDSKLKTNLTSNQARERRSEILLTFERMISYGKEQGVKAILIAGDLFDTGNITVRTKKAVEGAFINHPEIEFYYLKGNHDTDNFLSSLEEIPKNLHLFSEEWTSYQLENLTISGVELTAANSNTIYDSLLLNPDALNLVMMHGQEVIYQGRDKTEIIQIPALENKFIDYLALGHIHTHKKGSIDHRGSYCYSGCLEGRGYDECGPKGFVLLEVADAKISTTFVPFASRLIHEVEIDISDLHSSGTINQELESRLSNISKDDMVKVILKGKVPIQAERDLLYLETKYKDRFYGFKIEDDEVRLGLDPKDYEKDASLKGEFIRLLMGKELEEKRESAIIELGLKALAGEEINK